jgi:hypothetical protein
MHMTMKCTRKAIAAVKLNELRDIERQVLETARENIVAMEQVVYPTLAQEVERVWVAAMARRGIPADDARKI